MNQVGFIWFLRLFQHGWLRVVITMLTSTWFRGPFPKDDNGLGWVQIQRKSRLWEETIDDSTMVKHGGVTTLAHPILGWTIASGTWNTLRTAWGLTSETLKRIHWSDSCKVQERLQCAQVFTPTRHILQTIKQTWKIDRIHGLLAVSATAFPLT